MRAPVFLMLVLAVGCRVAAAEVTCEQYGAIAEQTVRLRDQGVSLKRVLAHFERREMKEQLTERELATLRDVVRHSFNSTLSPAEVVEACKQGGVVVAPR